MQLLLLQPALQQRPVRSYECCVASMCATATHHCVQAFAQAQRAQWLLGGTHGCVAGPAASHLTDQSPNHCVQAFSEVQHAQRLLGDTYGYMAEVLRSRPAPEGDQASNLWACLARLRDPHTGERGDGDGACARGVCVFVCQGGSGLVHAVPVGSAPRQPVDVRAGARCACGQRPKATSGRAWRAPGTPTQASAVMEVCVCAYVCVCVRVLCVCVCVC